MQLFKDAFLTAVNRNEPLILDVNCWTMYTVICTSAVCVYDLIWLPFLASSKYKCSCSWSGRTVTPFCFPDSVLRMSIHRPHITKCLFWQWGSQVIRCGCYTKLSVLQSLIIRTYDLSLLLCPKKKKAIFHHPSVLKRMLTTTCGATEVLVHATGNVHCNIVTARLKSSSRSEEGIAASCRESMQAVLYTVKMSPKVYTPHMQEGRSGVPWQNLATPWQVAFPKTKMSASWRMAPCCNIM